MRPAPPTTLLGGGVGAVVVGVLAMAFSYSDFPSAAASSSTASSSSSDEEEDEGPAEDDDDEASGKEGSLSVRFWDERGGGPDTAGEGAM